MNRSPRHREGGEAEWLAPYLASARRLPPLTREAEHELALRARDGDVHARQRLVRGCLAFVVAIARQQSRGTVRLDDLIQEGNLGLLRAAEKFDPYAGTRFSTYAAWWIRANIGRYLKEARSTVRPRSGTVAYADLSLDSLVDEETETTHMDRLQDGAAGPEETYLATENDLEVRNALGRVRTRVGELGWNIIHDRLQQDQRWTLEEIGKRWGLSRERVRQVELQTKKILALRLAPAERDAA
jgi:RNA polymerase primary sigma factor